MNRSRILGIVAVVLLAASGVAIAMLAQRNFSLQVEVADLKRKLETASKAPKPAATVAQAAPAAAPASGTVSSAPAEPRTLTNIEKALMKELLGKEEGETKKLWIRVDPADREAAAFAGEIAGVFRDSGWTVDQRDSGGVRYKPGLLMLVASDMETSSYVLTAQKVIEATGETLTTGTGYASYYQAKKAETPDWKGTEFDGDQTYVILVGRRPDAAPAQ